MTILGIFICIVIAFVLIILVLYGAKWITVWRAWGCFDKPSKEKRNATKSIWYGSAWMSCEQCSCYQVHNFGPYKSFWKAFWHAKITALDLDWQWQGEDSGIFFRVSKEPVIHSLYGR